MTVPAGVLFTFGLTIGLFLGFLLDLFWGPIAPFALALPVGFYTIYQSAAASRRHP